MSNLVVSPNCADLFQPTVEIRQFPDGENYVRVTGLENAKGKVYVLHRCFPKQDRSLIQLFLIVSVLRKCKNVTEIAAVVPYLPYSRQDKIFLDGEPISAHETLSLIKCAGCTELITFDCHFLKKSGEFEIDGLKVRNLTMGNELKQYFGHALKLKHGVFVSPDKGATYLSSEGYAMEKQRGEYGKCPKTAYRAIARLEANFEANGKTAVIIDDMIAGGSTMLKAVDVLREKGVESVYAATIHGLLLSGADTKLLERGVKEIVCSDTIKSAYSKVSIKKQIEKIIN